MIANLFLAAAVGLSGASPIVSKSVPAEISSKLALYLLTSTACDQIGGTDAVPTATSLSRSVLDKYGYSPAEIDAMLSGVVLATIDTYLSTIREVAENREDAIPYFCLTTTKQKKKLVEEIMTRIQP